MAFIDPKGSQVDIIQATGRAIRKSNDKDKGTIVIPVFIEDGDDPEEQIDASNFKPVWNVLKALRAHDEVLAESLDHYRTSLAKTGGNCSHTINDKIIFDLPARVSVEFSNALRTVLVEATTASWEFWYGLLEVFHEREGHCRVPVEYRQDGNKLGSWVNTQRNNRIKLAPERRKKLDHLGFVWDAITWQWEEGFRKLQKFHAREGHCMVPKDHKEDGFSLGYWVGNQRALETKLPSDRLERLEELGFVWNHYTELWEEGFGKLQRFYERAGHCRVPHSHKEDEYKLGQWVVVQRSTRSQIPDERIERLDELGFEWDYLNWQWEEGFLKLQEFHQRESHCRVPHSHREDGYKLGYWVATQRLRRSGMSAERINRLGALSFVWDSRSWR